MTPPSLTDPRPPAEAEPRNGSSRLRDELNFVLTNRIPRRAANRFMAWFSRLEVDWVRALSIALWQRFAPDLDLSEAAKPHFRSLHDCFVRRLKPGARPVDPDPDVLASPCDAVVGACGRLTGTSVVQAKGLDYELADLLLDDRLVARHRDGWFVTLRIKSSFYHRFHAPCDVRLSEVLHIAGDTLNVNPVAVERIQRLFCRNERAVVPLDTGVAGEHLTLVPVAAILVGGIRIHGLPHTLDSSCRGVSHRYEVSGSFAKGEEMGWFEHGSTIVAFASGDLGLAPGVATGRCLRVGEALFRRARHERASAPPTVPLPVTASA